MDTVPITPNLTMLRVNGWQLYIWCDDDSVTLIDTGAPGSGAEILSAVPGVDRIVLTHGHVDHCGSAPNCTRRPARLSMRAPVTRRRSGRVRHCRRRYSRTGKCLSINVFRSACRTRHRRCR
jgi:glyoxylase-like metal-dependent hydrolase (beta-lactamase superfamily II)